MIYTVTSVDGVFPAQYGKTRVNFTVQENPNKVSGFFLTPPTVGQQLDGDIVQKGNYWNFVFPKKDATFSKTPGAPDLNRVELKLDTIRTDIALVRGDLSDMRGVLGDILQKLGGSEAPF